MLQDNPHQGDHLVWIKQVIGAIWTCHRLARLGGTKINNGIERPEEKALFSSRPNKANPRARQETHEKCGKEKAADFLKFLRRRNQNIAADQKRERPTIEQHAHLFTNPNSTLSGSADTERDGAGDARLAIGGDRNRRE